MKFASGISSLRRKTQITSIHEINKLSNKEHKSEQLWTKRLLKIYERYMRLNIAK